MKSASLVLALTTALGGVGCAPSPSSDVVCDALGCISLGKFSANIAAALNNNTVGYVFYVGGLPSSFAGQARTTADPPSIAMLPDLATNVASLSKVLTTVGVLQSLTKHNLTIDDKILPYLYPDWTKGSNIDTMTFRDLLSHKSGFEVCGGDKVTYEDIREQIAAGVQLANKTPLYNNCNFAIFRELLPFMEGSSITGSDSQRARARTSISRI